MPQAIDIKRGDAVKLTGRLHYFKWTDEDGIEHIGCEIVAHNIILNPEGKQAEPKPITPSYTNAHGVTVDDSMIPF